MDKLCKICGTIMGLYGIHRCSNGRLIGGRSSYTIPIDTNWQDIVKLNNGEYDVMDKPLFHDENDYISLNVRANGLINISRIFNAKTINEIYDICSELEVDHHVEYNEKFIQFDLEEKIDWTNDPITYRPYISYLYIKFYKENNYQG